MSAETSVSAPEWRIGDPSPPEVREHAARYPGLHPGHGWWLCRARAATGWWLSARCLWVATGSVVRGLGDERAVLDRLTPMEWTPLGPGGFVPWPVTCVSRFLAHVDASNPDHVPWPPGEIRALHPVGDPGFLARHEVHATWWRSGHVSVTHVAWEPVVRVPARLEIAHEGAVLTCDPTTPAEVVAYLEHLRAVATGEAAADVRAPLAADLAARLESLTTRLDARGETADADALLDAREELARLRGAVRDGHVYMAALLRGLGGRATYPVGAERWPERATLHIRREGDAVVLELEEVGPLAGGEVSNG